ncbi:MAG: FtsB family cell division protein [Candidatus Aminicenantaceae bacterium]
MTGKGKHTPSFRRKFLISGAVFFLLVLLIASFFGQKGLLEIYKARREKAELVQRMERLENRKARLEMEIRELKTNPEAVEEKAREKLWMVKPQEIVIIRKDRF